MTDTAAWFANTLDRAQTEDSPFRHWLLDDALPEDVAHGIPALPIAPPDIGDTLGKRETHNTRRVFFSAENRARFPVVEEIASVLQSPALVEALERRTGAHLRGHYLRIEYCLDREGFWLEPHTDIGAKKFTMLVYLSETDDAGSWGTDFYDNDLKHLGQAPGGFNKGLIFIPGHDTWHGVEKRHYSGVRKSIIVNYVIPEWRSRHELAYPDQPV